MARRLFDEELASGRMKRVAEEKIENNLETDLAGLRKRGVHTALSPALETREEVLRGSPLFLDMTDSAKIIFDRRGFFGKFSKG
jgi:hypothetical protein